MTTDAAELADRYIDAGAIGIANRIDAQHIALATVNHVSVLVSWNFRHIVNLWRIQALQCREPARGLFDAGDQNAEGGDRPWRRMRSDSTPYA